MTMPHMMNCPHSDDSWCLSCVCEEWNRSNTEIARLTAEATKYESELTRAAERLQKAMGDYMGVGLLCVDAAIEAVVKERDELRAEVARREKGGAK